MVYGQQKKKLRLGSTLGTVLIVLVLFGVFVLAVTWFRSEPPQEEAEVDSIVNILTPDPISQAIINGAIDTEAREAVLRWVSTGEELGKAERGDKDGQYYLEINTLLPDIDREIHYYQVWMVRKIPYDFFSAGQMLTNDDGEFVLEWDAPDNEDYFAYTDLVITVNQFEGSADPGEHLVEGTFGK